MKKIAFLVIILAILSSVAFWRIWPNLTQQGEKAKGPIILTVWGFDGEQDLKPAISAFQGANPNIVISYEKQSLLNYVPRSQTQISEGKGPDVFLIQNSWVSSFAPFLKSAPETIFISNEFSQTFYPIARDFLVLDKKIYGLPKGTDGLAMFYNIDILRGGGVQVPKSWTEFVEAAKTVTVKNTDGRIQTAGASLGSTDNVDFWPEILALLFLQQPGADLNNPASGPGADALRFYTSFVLDPQKKVWDTTLPSSSKMFAEGKLAFYFAPSSEVQVLAQSAPGLNYGVAVVPQLPGKVITYGNFWAWVVSASSKNGQEAWQFLKFLSAQSLPTPNFISPRLDQGGAYLQNPKLGAYVLQAPYYKGWYLGSGTGNTGVNNEIGRSYADAINGVLQGKDALQSLQITQAQIKEIFKNYKVGQ